MKTDAQIRESLGEIFKDLDTMYTDGAVAIRRGDDGSVFIKITQMYEAPEHGLGMAEFVNRMCDAVGMKEMEEYDSFSKRGCETCDYGSCYGTEFRFWNP